MSAAAGKDGLQQMHDDSTAVLSNVRALRSLLKDCQSRIRELEVGNAVLRKTTTSSNDELTTVTLPLQEAAEQRPRSLASDSSPSPGQSRNDRPKSLTSHDEGSESKYVGSYGKLVSFVKASRAFDHLTDQEEAELLDAIEEISRMGSGQAVRKSQPLFKDVHHADFASVVSSMGIKDGLDMHHEASHGDKKAEGDGDGKLTRESSFVLDKDHISSSIKLLKDTRFNSRERTDFNADASMVAHCFCEPYNIMERYKVDARKLCHWVVNIAEQYKQNAYHNWFHALDVFQFCFQAMTRGQLADYFNFQDILALMTAALAHDVAHPGVTNAFLIATSHDICITYNDKSPLENMHSCLCFQTLRRDDSNFLSGLARSDFKVFRGKVIDAILATDMAHHFEMVDRLSARVSTQDSKPFLTGTREDKQKSTDSKDDRRMMIQAFTHMADLGHCCRPWEIHRRSVVGLETEFFSQGDKERDLGLPVMPLMDRTKDSAAAGQGFFLGKMVTPLLQACSEMLTPELARTLLDSTQNNSVQWTRLLEKYGKLTAAELVDKEDNEQ